MWPQRFPLVKYCSRSEGPLTEESLWDHHIAMTLFFALFCMLLAAVFFEMTF